MNEGFEFDIELFSYLIGTATDNTDLLQNSDNPRLCICERMRFHCGVSS